MALSFEQKLAKQKTQQERARKKQLERINSPEYKAKQLSQRIATNERMRARQLEKAKAKPVVSSKPPAKRPKPIVTRKPLKSKGLAGKARTTSEKSLHDKMAAIGCICCINAGLITIGNSYVSIHHCHGRTKKSSHEETLPLCAYHHDTPMDTKTLRLAHPNVFPIHAKLAEGGKSLWEKENGTQNELIAQVWAMIGYQPIFSAISCPKK